MRKHKNIIFIIFILTSYLSNASIVVWATKGDVFINNKSATSKMILDNESEILMIDNKSYLSLFDSEKHKLLEFTGTKTLNYEQIIRLFKKEPTLPALKEYSILNNEPIVDTSHRQPSRQYYDIFPNDRYQQHRVFVIGEEDTIKVKIKRYNSVSEDAHWRVFSLQNKDGVPLHFEQLKNKDELRLNLPVKKLDSTKFTNLDSKNTDTLCLLIVNLMTEQEKGSLNFSFLYDMSILVLKDSAMVEKRKPLKLISPKRGPGHQMYAILWALEHELIFDAHNIFNSISDKALKYSGYTALYQHWKHTLTGDYKYRPLDYILKE